MIPTATPASTTLPLAPLAAVGAWAGWLVAEAVSTVVDVAVAAVSVGEAIVTRVEPFESVGGGGSTTVVSWEGTSATDGR